MAATQPQQDSIFIPFASLVARFAAEYYKDPAHQKAFQEWRKKQGKES